LVCGKIGAVLPALRILLLLRLGGSASVIEMLAAQASPARRVLRSSGIGFPDGSNETCGKVGFAVSHGQRRFRSTCLTINSSGQTNRCAFGLPLSSGVRG